MTKTPELLACPNPFGNCNATQAPVLTHFNFRADTRLRHVVCHSCGLRGPVRDSDSKAITAWNTRHGLQAEASNGKLVEALRPFANAGEYLDLETDGFMPGDKLALSHEDFTIFEELKFGDFERARLALTQSEGETTSPRTADEAERLARVVAEVMQEDGGCWSPCSGCQESVDGYVSSRDYPYSDIFRCQPGAGCHECGGIGVLWEDGAFLSGYADFAREALASTPEDIGGAVPEGWSTRDAKAIAAAVVQSACETDPADPEHPDTILISCEDLESHVRMHVELADERAMLASTPAAPQSPSVEVGE
jgi:hypothetical protein